MNRLNDYEEELVYKLIENQDKLEFFMQDLFVKAEKDPIDDDRLRKTIGNLKRLEFINGLWADDMFTSTMLLSKIYDYASEYPRLIELSNEQVLDILKEARDKFGIDNILSYDITSCGHHQIGWEQVDEFEWRVKIETFDFVILNKTARFIIDKFAKYGYATISESLNDTKPRKVKYLSFKHKNLCTLRDNNMEKPDEFKVLFEKLLGACKSAQSFEPIKRLDENGINTYIRDLLKQHQFRIADQTLRGVSPSGKSAGELDIFVETHSGDPITVIEALKLDYINRSYIDLHINKIFGYDANGLKENIILIYSYAPNYLEFFNSYFEHIKNNEFEFRFIKNCKIKVDSISEIRIIESTYIRSGLDRKIYHVIVNFN